MSGTSAPGGAGVPPQLDTSEAHSARVWNYLLGGKDNFAADRATGDLVLTTFPGIAHIARVQRRFLARAVRYLAADAGITQFLDIGTGLPTAKNTHQVAQQIVPHARIVYVDNDPLVLVHAEALLTSAPGGVTSYIESDVRDPDTILREAARTLDFSQPVALMMLGILGQVDDFDEPGSIVTWLLDALPPGSYLPCGASPPCRAARSSRRSPACSADMDARPTRSPRSRASTSSSRCRMTRRPGRSTTRR